MYLSHQDTGRDHVELDVDKERVQNLKTKKLKYVNNKTIVTLASCSGSPVLSENFLLHINAA